MIRYLFIIISLSVICMANCKDVYSAISIVESGCNDYSIGDGGNAIGRFQIWPCYVNDVNRILGYNAFTLNDRKDPEKALQMIKIYTEYYGKRYERITGKKVTAEIIARLHNGGPNGFQKQCTLKYWHKVKSVLNQQ